jgi:hypothetical protein
VEDTPAEVRALVHRTVMKLSEEQRFLMCAEMFEMSKSFIAECLPDGLSADERKRAIFLKLYGFEMPRPLPAQLS